MYIALWDRLPGPTWLRILILVLVGAILIFVLATWVFPWIDGMLGSEVGTVDPAGSTGS